MKKIIYLALTLSLILPASATMVDDPLLYKVTVEQLEKQYSDEKRISWDMNAWVGYDLNKIYLYSEGEKPTEGKAESEHRLLYSRAVVPFWDLQLGAGYDKVEDADHSWGVIALSGLAPYFFETRIALLVGEDGNLGLRLDTEYEALLTQKLIMSPSLSAAMYSKDTPEMELGKGISDLTLGLRLRYEIRREFAPYIGIEWQKNFGNTKRFHPVDETYFTAGVKFWF
jgi:copper resistance protein B